MEHSSGPRSESPVPIPMPTIAAPPKAPSVPLIDPSKLASSSSRRSSMKVDGEEIKKLKKQQVKV